MCHVNEQDAYIRQTDTFRTDTPKIELKARLYTQGGHTPI